MNLQFHDYKYDKPPEGDKDYLFAFVKDFGLGDKTYFIKNLGTDSNGKAPLLENHKDVYDRIYWAEVPTPEELRNDW